MGNEHGNNIIFEFMKIFAYLKFKSVQKIQKTIIPITINEIYNLKLNLVTKVVLFMT